MTRPILLLHAIGEALWGTHWQTDMAAALKINSRTVRRWVAGEEIPPGVWTDLRRLMEERSARLADLRDRAKGL